VSASVPPGVFVSGAVLSMPSKIGRIDGRRKGVGYFIATGCGRNLHLPKVMLTGYIYG